MTTTTTTKPPEPVPILLVDDLEENLLALEALLRRDGLLLLRARSGTEALELLLKHEIALALVDVQMPAMDGFELAELMRGTERTRRVPIIFLTAGGANHQRRFRGYEAGAVDFLLKPIEPDILRSKLDVFVELYRQRQEVARRRDELAGIAQQNARLLEESRRSADALRARERELRSVADNTPDMLTRFDRKLRHVFVNAAVERATGRPRSEILGRTDRELGMQADLCDRWEAGLTSVFETGRPRSLEFAGPGPAGGGGGAGRHFVAQLLPECGPNGTVEYVLAVVHDVTDRKLYEGVLRDQDRRKDEFLATLAHELRNPLGSIRNGLQVLQAGTHGEGAAGAIEMMGRQLAHMVRLVDDLLDVSRIATGKVELKRERIQVRSVLEHAVEASRPLLEEARHELTIDHPDEPVWLDGDPTRLAQVVGNLLNNAAKYTPEGGRIGLSAAVDGDRVVIQVRDNGSGISREMLPQVFGMFAQVDRTLDRAQGLGIGLPLVKKLAEMHGGTIEAESPGPGRGSTFTVRLSRAPAPTTPAAPSPPARPAAESSGRPSLRILVVDDSEDGARILAMLLKISGHTTRVAHDGPEALEAAGEFRPDLIFLDIGLPGMDGYEVCRRLRARPELAATAIVALTGWGGEEDRRRTRDAGFASHLAKPVDPDQIEVVLQSAIAAHRAGPATED